MTDGKATALVAHRQAFHWVYPSYVATKPLPKGAPKQFPAMFTGKFPLPEATIYSRAIRNASEADTHDRGIYYMETVEPGLDGNYIYDYAISSQGLFDPVAARKLGSEFNLPLRAEYVQVTPVQPRRSYFSVDQPNVEIVTVKPLSDNVVRGEVSAAPLDPQTNRIFVVRLQEFAGRATTARIQLPVAVRSAAIVSLTEDRVVEQLDSIRPLTVSLRPYQTLTVRFETE